ncbi:unnamed protein product [Ilex paraguariensis]|uniref:Uncharacterized protein n=1 Tax=Ilex paraguariensis TaxID=185542 RepID=A0ABC8SYW7_9AQUA
MGPCSIISDPVINGGENIPSPPALTDTSKSTPINSLVINGIESSVHCLGSDSTLLLGPFSGPKLSSSSSAPSSLPPSGSGAISVAVVPVVVNAPTPPVSNKPTASFSDNPLEPIPTVFDKGKVIMIDPLCQTHMGSDVNGTPGLQYAGLQNDYQPKAFHAPST